MNVYFKTHHWVQILLSVFIATLIALAQQKELAPYSGMFNGLASFLGTLALSLGLTGDSILRPPGTSELPDRRDPADRRGFVRARALVALALLGLVGCGALVAAAPAATALAKCVEDYVSEHPGLAFEQYVIGAAFNCDVDILDVLNEILKSSDPNLAQFKAQAQAAKADPSKLAALRGRLAARRGIVDAGSR